MARFIMIVGIEQLFLSPWRENKTVPVVPVDLIRELKSVGQIHPVVVRPGQGDKFEILANAETWLGVQRIGMHTVDISTLDGVDDEEAARIVNSATGDDPISEAEWFESQLKRAGQGGRFSSIASLARSVGLSRSYVSHSLRLLNLGEPIQKAIRAGALEVGHAKILLGVKDEHLQTELATKAIQGKWSVRALSRARKNSKDGVRLNEPRVEKKKSADVLSLERSLSGLVGSRVDIDVDAGILAIDYGRNNEVLQGVIERLGFETS